jgi:signal transduction histidine kinase
VVRGVEEAGAVLIVDDNPLIVNIVTSLLASNAYRVFTSRNGEEALGVLENKEIDVVICDVMMPKMDGYTLHEKIRERAELSFIPFIFLTALDEPSEMERGKEIGADEYLTKPFDPRQLLSVVRGKLSRSKKLREAADERYDAYRKRIIHTLSHEFRTPLVAINTGTELLLEQGQEMDLGKVTHLLEAIRRGGERLEKLVNDFMVLQQIEAGIARRVYESRAVAVRTRKVVENFVEAHRSMVEGAGFVFSCFLECGDERVKVYDMQIFEVLLRLVSNAMKFSTHQKVVELFAYRQESETVIEVRDRGPGIDLMRVEEAIDVFGQLDREKLEQQGGGLGLAIASRYAHLNGARLEFDHRAGGGTVVSLLLPNASE